jgi:hypothetical protein
MQDKGESCQDTVNVGRILSMFAGFGFVLGIYFRNITVVRQLIHYSVSTTALHI